MKQKMEEDHSILKPLKEYLPLIVVIPTLIGGTIQIIQLFSLSSTFIRFFSITQALSDGLLSLTFLAFITLLMGAFLSLRPFYLDLKQEIMNSKQKEWFKKVLNFLFDFIVYSIISFCTVFCFCFFIRSNFVFVEVFDVLLIISLIFGFLFSMIINPQKKLNIKEGGEKEEQDSLKIKWNQIIVYYTTILLLILFTINKANSQVQDIYNKENIGCYLELLEFKYELNDFEIKYFNDNYIFIELYFKDTKTRPLPKNQKKSMFTVLKFESFMNFEKCSELYKKP